MGDNSLDIGQGDDFFFFFLDYSKPKCFCKGNQQQNETQSTEWEKILLYAKHMQITYLIKS